MQETLTLFIDTTVPVELTIGEASVRRELQAIMTPYELWSSTYVLMEFQRTAVHALKVVQKLAGEVPADQSLFAYILRRIERGYGGTGVQLLSERQRARCRSVLASVDEHFPKSVPGAVVVAYLDSIITLAHSLAWLGIRLVDTTNCDLVRPERLQGRRWPLHCNAQLAECQQSQFLEAHRANLQRVLTACRTDAAFDDEKMLKVLEAILKKEPILAKGEKRCWALGDLIIALEATPYGKLLSSNKKHYSPICQALGLELLTFANR